MLCHGERCLLLRRDRGEHALSSRSPADLALARDKGPRRGDAAFLLSRRFVKMEKKSREVLVQRSRGERQEVRPTRVSLCGTGSGDKAAFAGWAANIKLFSHSLKHFAAAVKGCILFLIPVHKGFSAKWQILCLFFSASLSRSSFCSAAEFQS